MSIVPTMRCTLHCRLCSNHMSQFKNPMDATVEEMKRDIDTLFGLFDHISWLQFVGGEVFLHGGMAEVYRYCQKHRQHFDRLILESNATILPQGDVVEALKAYGEAAMVMISDYGAVSGKRNECVELFERNQIPYSLKKYYGNEQHYGGWIDNTMRRDLGESEDVVWAKAANCPQVRLENMHCYRGKLHRCSNSLFLSELGIVVPHERDYLDLYDESLTMVEKQAIVADFYRYPRQSCRFCAWKDADSLPRFPAGEQI